MPPPAPQKSSYQEKTLELIRSSNLVGLSAAVPGGMKVGVSQDFSSNLLGQVEKKNPRTIALNAELADPSIGGGFKQVIPHEWEHVLQYTTGERYGKSYDKLVAEQYTAMGGSTPKLVSQLERSASSSKLHDHLTKLVGTQVAPYLGKLSSGQFSLKEQFAELSALEATAKKDLTKDPVVRAEFFGNDQAMIDTYKATTGYRTTRTDARDLPPMTASASTSPGQSPESSVLDKILSTIKGAKQ